MATAPFRASINVVLRDLNVINSSRRFISVQNSFASVCGTSRPARFASLPSSIFEYTHTRTHTHTQTHIHTHRHNAVAFIKSCLSLNESGLTYRKEL